MQTRLTFTFLSFAIIATSAGAADRWRDKLPESRLYSGLGFLKSKEVHAELQLTEKQSAVVAEAYSQIAKRIGAALDELKNQGVTFDREGFALLHQASARVEIEESNRVFEVLSESQQKRATEISLQLAGVLALQYRGLATTLRLTDEQRDQVDSRFVEFEEKSRAAIAEFRKEPKRRDNEAKRLVVARRDAIEAILTEEQRAKYKSLKGEPSPAGESDN